MQLSFTKMQGAGNDFVVLDATARPIELRAEQWRALADRHFGIGADQILLVERARSPQADFRYRIFNADGHEVEQCGNGARCFVRFVYDKRLTDKRALRVETLAGIIEPRLEDDGRVTVDMGRPRLEPADVPFDTTDLVPRREAEALLWPLALDGSVRELVVLSMGNPHAVQQVRDVQADVVAVEGPRIESHPRFARGVNAGFMQVLDADTIRLRVYERGVGETLACGTGACAAVVAGILRGRLNSTVQVHTRGGQLTIRWERGSVSMTGPAHTVYEGVIDVPELRP